MLTQSLLFRGAGHRTWKTRRVPAKSRRTSVSKNGGWLEIVNLRCNGAMPMKRKFQFVFYVCDQISDWNTIREHKLILAQFLGIPLCHSQEGHEGTVFSMTVGGRWWQQTGSWAGLSGREGWYHPKVHLYDPLRYRDSPFKGSAGFKAAQAEDGRNISDSHVTDEQPGSLCRRASVPHIWWPGREDKQTLFIYLGICLSMQTVIQNLPCSHTLKKHILIFLYIHIF